MNSHAPAKKLPPFWEVQSYGVTLEWTNKLKEAQDCFQKCYSKCQLVRIDAFGQRHVSSQK